MGIVIGGIAIAPIIKINISKSEGLEEKVLYRSRVSLDSNLEGNIKQ